MYSGGRYCAGQVAMTIPIFGQPNLHLWSTKSVYGHPKYQFIRGFLQNFQNIKLVNLTKIFFLENGALNVFQKQDSERTRPGEQHIKR